VGPLHGENDVAYALRLHRESPVMKHRNLLSVSGLFLFVSLATGSDESKTGGTLTGNQMDAYASEYIADQGVLEPDEEIRVYYDVTLMLDSSEFAMVTNRRVVYWKNGTDTSMDLIEVESIDVHEEGLIGTVIDIKSRDGTPMRIEVAPMNGGDLFASELESAWHGASPGE